jgi:hypothetical protein
VIHRILAAPAAHFVAIGAVLFLSQDIWAPASEPAHGPDRRIVVDSATLDDLREGFRKTAGRQPTTEETGLLVRDYADTEILYREALARGLDKADRSVKWRLVQKMQFLDDAEESGGSGEDGDHEALYREALALGLDRDDLIIRRLLIEKMKLLIKLAAVREPPGEEALQRYYQATTEDYRQPRRISLRHVFLSSDRRGEALPADAARLLERIRAAALDPAAAIGLGDVFPLGHEMRGSSEQGLAKLLGPDFARAAIELQPARWHGPIASAYGLHLVWVDDAQESSLPGLAAVRSQVTQRYLAELRDAELDRSMAEMRRRYAISIAGAVGEERSADS